MLAWEATLARHISAARRQELRRLWRRFVLTSASAFVFGSAPVLVALATFGTYASLEPQASLTADKVQYVLRAHCWVLISITTSYFP